MLKRLLICAFLTTSSALAQPTFDDHLASGRLSEARATVMQLLADHPERDDLKFQLALVQLLGSLEKFSQTMYGYGLQRSVFGDAIPFLRYPVAANPNARPVTNEAVRATLAEFLAGLSQCQTTLSSIPDDSPVKLPFRLGRVRLDTNGDGLIGSQEQLWRVYRDLNPRTSLNDKTGPKLGMHLDVGDVRWLEGYCHVLGAMGETILAYDTEELFQHTAHLFFARPQTRYPYLKAEEQFGFATLADLVTFLHLLNFPVKEPARLQNALAHLEQVTALSRRSWKAILAETDDVYEWIPNPRQKGVLPNGRVTQEMVNGWLAFLDEADAILAGKRLLPFWRTVPPGHGLNARRMFTEPAPFDAVLWMQGSGLERFLEKGDVTDPTFWDRLSRVFQGDFLGYALWFN